MMVRFTKLHENEIYSKSKRRKHNNGNLWVFLFEHPDNGLPNGRYMTYSVGSAIDVLSMLH